jgi:excisionase family DNA binding protein
MPNRPPPMSVAEVAYETGIARRTVQQALTDGELKAHKFPGQTGVWVIERADVTDWLKRRRAAALRAACPNAT